MPDPIVGCLAAFFFALFLATFFFYWLAKRNAPGKVIPFWQGLVIGLVAVIAVTGLVGMSIVGQEHFQGEFQENYLYGAGFLAFMYFIVLN